MEKGGQNLFLRDEILFECLDPKVYSTCINCRVETERLGEQEYATIEIRYIVASRHLHTLTHCIHEKRCGAETRNKARLLWLDAGCAKYILPSRLPLFCRWPANPATVE